MGQKIVTLSSILVYTAVIVLASCTDVYKTQKSIDKRYVFAAQALDTDTIISDGWLFKQTFATKDTFFIVADRKTNFILLSYDHFTVPKIITYQRDSLFYGNSIWGLENNFLLNKNHNHIVYGITNNRQQKFRVYYKSIPAASCGNNAFQLAVSGTLPQSLKTISQDSLKLPIIQITLNEPLHFSGQKRTAAWNRPYPKDKIERIEIGIRGNTSRSFLKKQFKVHSNLTGQREKFALNGPYADFSLIRNALAFDLGREIGLDAPSYSFYNLVINNFYEGIYVLINKPTPHQNELLLSIDEKPGFSIRQNDAVVTYQVKPKDKHKQHAQNAVMQLYANEKDFNKLKKALPLEEVIDYLLLHELTKNIDSYKKSFYLRYDTIQEQFSFGPLWDFNFSLGNTFLSNGDDPTGFVYEHEENQAHFPSWWLNYILFDEFQREMKTRYAALRKSYFRTAYLHEKIDVLVAQVENDVHFNFQRWPIAVGHQYWAQPAAPKSFKEEINRMKTFLEERLIWMDSQLLKTK